MIIKGLTFFGSGSSLTDDDIVELQQQSDPGYATPAVVQSTEKIRTGTGTNTPVFSGPTAAGNVVLVALFTDLAATHTDPGASWDVVTSIQSVPYRLTLFRRNITTGGFTSQLFEFSAVSNSITQMFEISGIQNVAADKFQTNSGTGTTASTGTTGATTQADDFVLTCFGANGAHMDFENPTAPFAQIRETLDSPRGLVSYSKNVTATGTQTCSTTIPFSGTGGADWLGLIAAFKATDSVGDPNPPDEGKLRLYAKSESGSAARPYVIDEVGTVSALARGVEPARINYGTDSINVSSVNSNTKLIDHGLGVVPDFISVNARDNVSAIGGEVSTSRTTTQFEARIKHREAATLFPGATSVSFDWLAIASSEVAPGPSVPTFDLTVSATATPTLTMRAATRVVLQSAAALATPTLAVSAGGKLVPLAAATCVATPTLAVRAPTKVVLAAAACAASPTLALTAPSAFLPSDISGLKVWLKADTLGLADNANVTSWTDSSGTANHFTGTGPTYKTGILNSKAIVRFDGTDDYLTATSSLAALTAGEIFLVVKTDADPSVSEAKSGLYAFGKDGLGTHYPYPDSNIYDDFGTNTRKSTGNPSAALTSWNVYNVSSASGAWTSRINGTQHYTTASNTVSFPGSGAEGNARIGRGGPSYAYYFDGDLAEVILYDSVLSSGNRASVLSYLQSKWGL